MFHAHWRSSLYHVDIVIVMVTYDGDNVKKDSMNHATNKINRKITIPDD